MKNTAKDCKRHVGFSNGVLALEETKTYKSSKHKIHCNFIIEYSLNPYFKAEIFTVFCGKFEKC